MKVIILLLLFTLSYNQNVISRNKKVNEMITELKENQQMYDQLITQVESKITSDYEACINEIKDQNCSDSEVWQQQRSKSSKNITNLQEKIKKHNRTIDAILQLNKHEVTKQNLTMAKLFPKVEKVKNDIELIENMMFLIEDTYLNLDTAGKSILLLFNHQFQHPKAQQMQKSFIQLMNSRSKQEKGAEEETEPAQEQPEEQQQQQQQQQTEESSNDEYPPLIDEDLFDGEIDQSEIEVANLFAPSKEEKKKQFLAERIPDGVNVAEHDANGEEMADLEGEEDKQEEQFEDLRIYEVQEQFKDGIKELGKQMHDELEVVLNGLNTELDQLTQSIADLEKAIMDLHHKHAKQIVQIYIETKRLQSQIFELDDGILILDARIFDCQNSNEKLEQCESRKGIDQIFLDDLKTEKSFNQGIIKEMEKLLQFEDKNVYEPDPMLPIENIKADIEPKSEEEVTSDQENQEIQQRIASIKQEEKIVEQQLEVQTKEEQLQKEESMQPEHLIEVPEIQSENQEKAKEKAKPEVKKEEEEEKVLEEVDKEIQAEEQEQEAPEQQQQEQQIQEEQPAAEEPVEALEEGFVEWLLYLFLVEEPKLEFLKKHQKKKIN